MAGIACRLERYRGASYLAHGDSLFSSANLFRVGVSTTYKIVVEVCPLIWELLSPIYLSWKSAAELEVVAHGYRARWNLPNCLGALDGKEIRIRAPPHSGSMFYCYKKFFSFKVLSICDAFYRFTWISVGDYGSISDLSAFRNTELYKALEQGEIDLPRDNFLPRSNIRMPYFFIGDAIFELKKYLMTPYNRNNLVSEEQRIFNERLSRGRNTIEDTYGVWTSKFQILNTRLNFSVANSKNIIQACVCLHNFIINEEMLDPSERRRQHVPRQVAENVQGVPRHEEVFADVPHDVHEQRNALAGYFSSPAGALLYL
ncbi:putative nuclease HARBI1 [Leptopilina boulardi]|uniref:putative nuclease HARBI1 n=1 Tax=Leptopilina boulardi TaxID=63433 RepID=UPI0021F5EF6B|nr:putative nuclease HARBI1 [Leptopilina boulardi]